MNVGTNLASKIDKVDIDYKMFLGNSLESLLLDKNLTYKEFDDSISSLRPNKAAGFDDLNSNVILHIMSSIRKPLFHVLHLSIKDGVFPDLLKLQKLILFSYTVQYLLFQYFLRFLNELFITGYTTT